MYPLVSQSEVAGDFKAAIVKLRAEVIVIEIDLVETRGISKDFVLIFVTDMKVEF